MKCVKVRIFKKLSFIRLHTDLEVQSGSIYLEDVIAHFGEIMLDTF